MTSSVDYLCETNAVLYRSMVNYDRVKDKYLCSEKLKHKQPTHCVIFKVVNKQNLTPLAGKEGLAVHQDGVD